MRRNSHALLVSSVLLALLIGSVEAQGANRMALVVVHGDGSMITRCISFDEAEITGYDVLQRSGLSLRITGYGGKGAAVCAIDGEGCLREDEHCFCQCLGTPCFFWTYWLWRDGQWVFSQAGASTMLLHNGDLQAWFWADGQTAPPAASFDQICPPPPTETPLPTETPPPTDTPAPTDTPVPTDTPPPTEAPTQTAVPTATLSATSTPVATLPPTETVLATTAMQPSATFTARLTLVPATPTEATPSVTRTSTSAASSPSAQQTATLTTAPTATQLTAATASAPTSVGPVATPKPPSTVPVAQYALFAVTALVLIAGFWIMRGRQRER